jgi:hypothetical protein
MLGLGAGLILPPVIGGSYNNLYSLSANSSSAGGFLTGSPMQALFRDSWTFSGWFKFLDGQTNPPNGIFGAKEDNNNIIACTTSKNNSQIYVSFKGNGDQHMTMLDGNSWGNGATGWNHVAVTCVKSGTVTITIYVNGSTPAQTTSSTITPSNMAAFTNTNNVCVGGMNTGSGMEEGLRGYIDEVAFFDSALNHLQITDLYNSGVPTDLTSLSPVHWYHFNGQSAEDFGSGGNDGNAPEEGTYQTDIPS